MYTQSRIAQYTLRVNHDQVSRIGCIFLILLKLFLTRIPYISQHLKLCSRSAHRRLPLGLSSHPAAPCPWSRKAPPFTALSTILATGCRIFCPPKDIRAQSAASPFPTPGICRGTGKHVRAILISSVLIVMKYFTDKIC